MGKVKRGYGLVPFPLSVLWLSSISFVADIEINDKTTNHLEEPHKFRIYHFIT